ncbi:MAG: alpha/beta fold hydrolase [Dehalococcoidales bacterium]|nr:alpha/beta fold hydrolase [Dehalococcoidales bacterium]
MVGHSFGGRLSLGVAVARPDQVDKLVLADAAGLGKVSKLAGVMFTAFYRARSLLGRSHPHPTFLARDGDDPDWACVEDLPKIQSPTLIVWKQRDPYVPVANAHRAVTLIPDARLELLPGIGHAPHLSNADAFNRLVGEFLGNVSAGA